MSDAYITLWSQPQVEIERRSNRGGKSLDHAAGPQFRARGVKHGDHVYVVATSQGELLLLGRLTVDRVVGQREADEHFKEHVYEAPDHLIGSGSALNLDGIVPEDIARELQRASGKRLKIDPHSYRVEANSLRTTGRLTERSAALLDSLLTPAVQVDTDQVGFQKGGRQLRRHEAIERSSAVRARALAIHGSQCSVCGFSFAATYGPLGEGFAEVHHLAPLASLQRSTRVNPARDVVILCANCHRMVHRRSPLLSPRQLARELRRRPR